MGKVEKQGMECRGRFGCQGPFFRAGVNDCVVSDSFLLSLSMRKRGFNDLLKARLSSLLMLCGCISSSMASVMSRSIYPVFAWTDTLVGVASAIKCSISCNVPLICKKITVQLIHLVCHHSV